LTGRTDAIAALEDKVASPMGLEGAGLLAARLERELTLGTERVVVGRGRGPVGSRGGKGSVLEHFGAEAGETLVNGGFDLGEGRFGMLEAPLVDAAENVLTEAAPVLVEVVPAHTPSLVAFRPSSYALTFVTAILPAKL
jgi:hypothetical protein